jgi:hypothetical protein
MWRIEQKHLPLFLRFLFVYLFTVLTTQSVFHTIWISVSQWKIVNNELKWMYNVAVVSYF